MFAHFIDVGQGDAALLEFPCGAVMIDAGAQDAGHRDALIRYLQGFFERRADLRQTDPRGTLDAVFITHTHVDHNAALEQVVRSFRVGSYVHNGLLRGSGRHAARWMDENAASFGVRSRPVLDSEITALPVRAGLTGPLIDPIHCAEVDPEIRVLSGQMEQDPGWPSGEFENGNNHSLVVRIDYGQASFLFTGDLEEPALESLVDWYRDTSALDVDVYQVGHHGSHNGTTESLLDAATPEIAVISMGRWDFGRDPFRRFSTWAYGHPREHVTDMLSRAIRRRRSAPRIVHVALGPRSFEEERLRDAIYATGWDGTVIVRATVDGRYIVRREH